MSRALRGSGAKIATFLLVELAAKMVHCLFELRAARAPLACSRAKSISQAQIVVAITALIVATLSLLGEEIECAPPFSPEAAARLRPSESGVASLRQIDREGSRHKHFAQARRAAPMTSESVVAASGGGQQQRQRQQSFNRARRRTNAPAAASVNNNHLAASLGATAAKPEFAAPVGNVSAVLGRDVRLVCTVDNLGHHQVSSSKAFECKRS